METGKELREKETGSNDKVKKKRGRSEKRFGAVNFPDWRITNGQSRTTQLVVSYEEGKQISKLREPRNLFALPNRPHHYSNINLPRWPMEMKVLKQHPRHQNYLPSDPEMFYNADLDKTSTASFPVLTKAKDGELVYENSIGQSKFFDFAQVGGSAIKAKPNIFLKTNASNTLCFESRFESGNLLKAVKVGPFDYQLWLRTDLYTKKYTQWYYFRVDNTLPERIYRFTIMNLMKPSSLYSNGMKPLMYSDREAKEKGIGWTRVGMNIKYYKNELKQDSVKGERYYYSLSWTFNFPHAGDRCYFAHCYPYTYTDLQEYLRKISREPSMSHYCKQKMLTRTLAGNFVYIITITSPSKCPADAKNKRAVVVTARVHPGETNSSWMMKGLLDFLTSDKPDAKLLRDTFVFKIVPMLNPDGVIVGNYRCSLSGRDLNRNYKTVLKDAFPSVWHTREMVKGLSEEREVTLYCDLHGHSRQQNVFIYGCEDLREVSSGFSGRVFPMMMSKNCKDKFSFKRCKFKVQKSKTGTGRVVMWNLGIKNSFTVEATFCGSTLGSKSGQHFTTADYESMGYHLCDTLLDYCDPDVSKYFSVLNELEIYVKALVLERMKEKGVAKPDMDPSDVDLNRDYTSELESSTSGSDSSVSDGLPMHLLYSRREKKKKKHLKTRKERNRRRERTLVERNSSSVKEKQDQPPPSPSVHRNTSPQNCRPKSNVSSLERKKYSASRHTESKTSPQHPEQKVTEEVTAVHQVENIKIHRYLESMPNPYIAKTGETISSNHSREMPHLRYTGTKACFGLAPATPIRSLKRWSVQRTPDEDNFIGPYMARQIRISQTTRESDCESRNDKTEQLHETPLFNENYKAVAAAQSQDDDEDNRDHKERKGNKGAMDKYCPHHTEILPKASEKEDNEDGGTFSHLDLNKESPLSSELQLSSSYETISTAKSARQFATSSKKVLSGKKFSQDIRKEERRTARYCKKGHLLIQSKSEESFPSLNKAEGLCLPNEKAKKLFNFRGVLRRPNYNSNHNLSCEQHSKSKQFNNLYDEELPLAASSCTSSDHSAAKRSREKQHPGDISPCIKDLAVSKDPKITKEPLFNNVNRLRQKLKTINASGPMVTVALNNQLDNVEDVLPKSLLEDYISYQKSRNVSHFKTSSKMKRKESKIKNTQQKLHVFTTSPTLWNDGENVVTEGKWEPKKM